MSNCCWPFSSQVEPGWNQFISLVTPVTNDSQKELVSITLPVNQPLVTIPFAVTKASNNLVVVGPTFINTVDTTPLTGLSFVVTNFSTSAMTILLNGNIPNTHYTLKFLVLVVG